MTNRLPNFWNRDIAKPPPIDSGIEWFTIVLTSTTNLMKSHLPSHISTNYTSCGTSQRVDIHLNPTQTAVSSCLTDMHALNRCLLALDLSTRGIGYLHPTPLIHLFRETLVTKTQTDTLLKGPDSGTAINSQYTLTVVDRNVINSVR